MPALAIVNNYKYYNKNYYQQEKKRAKRACIKWVIGCHFFFSLLEICFAFAPTVPLRSRGFQRGVCPFGCSGRFGNPIKRVSDGSFPYFCPHRNRVPTRHECIYSDSFFANSASSSSLKNSIVSVPLPLPEGFICTFLCISFLRESSTSL